MAIVNSVLGPLETSELGFTLMHEHIIVGSAAFYRDYPDFFGPNLMDDVVKILIKAKAGGVNSIVDATTLDLGREIHLIEEVSRRTGVNIIACSGWWRDIPRYFVHFSVDQLSAAFIKEIEQGIADTNIKAGILKAASDIEGIKPDEENVLRAVARAHLKTGAPLMLHSYSPAQIGRQQLAILKEEGVNLNRVKIDHANDTTDVEYLMWLLDQGCFLGMDRYHKPVGYTSTLARTKTLKVLIDAGYAERLCPSHDQIIRPLDPRFPLNPNGFLYLKEVVFPLLWEMGISEKITDRLCVDGPRNFFEAS
ncbi:phosphotriesterase [Thermodesulfobacteriota bacterium]